MGRAVSGRSSILAGTLILLLGAEKLDDAFDYIKLSAAMNGAVMFLYSITLLWINRFRLPPKIRMSWPRLLIMIWSILFFGYFAVWAGWDLIAGS